MDNDLIRKRTIKGWLDNYDALVFGDRRPDQLPSNKGAKPYDGVGAGRLNKIMLQAAIKELPPILKEVVRARWIDKDGLNFTLRRLCLSKDEYYKRCDWSIYYLCCCINKDSLGKSKILKKICKPAKGECNNEIIRNV